MSLSANHYRCHNYKFLLKRWRKVCNATGLNFNKVAVSDDYPCYEISSYKSKQQNLIYISAGIHGDEPGSTEGLLSWAESHLNQLSSLPLLIYPCLNPWGLENNSRLDANRTDLNRTWKDPENILVTHIMSRTKTLKLKLVLNLHEDFDGQGVYLYEPSRAGRSNGKAEKIIRAAASFISPDPRKIIDGRKSRNGIIRPRPANPPKDGIPEALYFYLMHHCSTYTFETPSELSIDLRVEAHKAMIKSAISVFNNF